MSIKTDNTVQRIGFGGGCHWCTEAYFQSLTGVVETEQGWISSPPPHGSFSEAVIVHYEPKLIPLQLLISIHLHTHACTSLHSLREKYRSAVYVIEGDIPAVQTMIDENQASFSSPIITQALSFSSFRLNDEKYHDYFQKNKGGDFCERHITPKLEMLRERYSEYFKEL